MHGVAWTSLTLLCLEMGRVATALSEPGAVLDEIQRPEKLAPARIGGKLPRPDATRKALLRGGGARNVVSPRQHFLLAYFTLNGQYGLQLAESPDGHRFHPLNGGHPVMQPHVGQQMLMRDPSICIDAHGTMHLFWTTGWVGVVIGYTSTRDLHRFSEQRAIGVMAGIEGVKNVWAPDCYYEAQTDRLHVVWASTVAGRFPATESSSENEHNHRLYHTSFQPGNLTSIKPAKLLYDPGFNVIDGTIVCDDLGDRHLLFFKDERRYPEPKKTLHVAVSNFGPGGPYGKPGPAIAEGPFWAEGPTVLRINGSWVVYYDKYANVQQVPGLGTEGIKVEWRAGDWGAVVSSDLENWVPMTPPPTMPEGARHGTVMRLPPEWVTMLARYRVGGHHDGGQL